MGMPERAKPLLGGQSFANLDRRCVSFGNLTALDHGNGPTSLAPSPVLQQKYGRVPSSSTFSNSPSNLAVPQDDDEEVKDLVVEIQRGAKQAEVYGFVLWITTALIYVIFLLWSFLPAWVLESCGVTYYPSRYWALAIPAWLIMLLVFAVVLYNVLNLMHTEPLDSYNLIRDNYSRKPVGPEVNSYSKEEGIPPITDLPIDYVNRFLYRRH